MAELVFWLTAGLLVYAYVVFPAMLAIALRFVPKGNIARQSNADLPSVAVVLSAFNERSHIADRIANLESQDYPADKLRIYVGSDGSDDGTAEILEGLRSARVEVRISPRRRGKAAMLNELIASTREQVIVFSDANVTFDRAAVAKLVLALSDADVGAVCGELFLQSTGSENQDSVYWRVERFLKAAEGRLGALLGANGAIYAIRKELYEPLPEDTIIDDFVIAMRIASRGWRLAYEPAARAWEDTPPSIGDEFRRRVRIGMGNFQALFRYPEFVLRTSLPRAWAYFSHKVLRWFGPHLLVVNLLAAAWLATNSRSYAAIVALQVAGYAVVALCAWARSRFNVPRLLLGLVLFATLNAAFAVAFWKYLLGDLQGQWSRTERTVQ
jgi:cellulose synthase/poly-beta-1,6-N-acetylglucosamine synthase-like glycosyltransferase